jgi:hypothetical protein
MPRFLDKYKKTFIVDVYGKKHLLETDLEKIQEIELGRENVEMAELYAIN